MKNEYFRNLIVLIGCFILTVSFTTCNKEKTPDNNPPGSGTNPNPPAAQSDVDFYLTKADQTALFQKQTYPITFKETGSGSLNIDVDASTTYQTIDGFGFTLTDGSAQLIMSLPDGVQIQLLKELFGNESDAIGISYLRLSIGASDLSSSVYTYDDMPEGQEDLNLERFNLRQDKSQVIPLLKKILAINPDIKLLGSPWTAPLWMKNNFTSVGGRLLPKYYDVYAGYFVKYIQSMEAEGITIDAITVQNEPLHGGNNPSMEMQAGEQTDFIKGSLGPAFADAGIKTKIIIWDHNADNPQYPITVLNDADARQYIDGSAFHLYNGDISALSTVHNAYPDKNLYFTEQYTPSNGAFSGDLQWHIKNVIIGSMLNWSKNALEWNLASDPDYSIHTDGGCTTCKGGITVTPTNYSRNVGYYIIAHASKLVLPGSKRIASSILTDLPNAAFQRPDGKKVLIVLNDGSTSKTFNIAFNNRKAAVSLDPGAVGTFLW